MKQLALPPGRKPHALRSTCAAPTRPVLAAQDRSRLLAPGDGLDKRIMPDGLFQHHEMCCLELLLASRGKPDICTHVRCSPASLVTPSTLLRPPLVRPPLLSILTAICITSDRYEVARFHSSKPRGPPDPGVSRPQSSSSSREGPCSSSQLMQLACMHSTTQQMTHNDHLLLPP